MSVTLADPSPPATGQSFGTISSASAAAQIPPQIRPATDTRPTVLALLAYRTSTMQAQGLEANGSGSTALQAQQLAGERLVNQCRIGLTAFGGLTILTGAGSQTRAANGVFIAVVCVLAIHAGVVWKWAKSGRSQQSTRKYLSVWIDISCLYALHVASLVNHSGAYEVFRAPGVWLMIGVFNGLGAVRYSAKASLFSVFVTLFYGGALLLVVRHFYALPWLDKSTFIGPGLNLFDCLMAVVFAAVPAVCSAVVAWHSEELLARSTRDAAGRASAEDRQRQILDAMADMILVKDADSKIVWANRALREAWGTDNDHLLGQDYKPALEARGTQSFARTGCIGARYARHHLASGRTPGEKGRSHLAGRHREISNLRRRGASDHDRRRVTRRERSQEARSPAAADGNHVHSWHTGRRHGARNQQSAHVRDREFGIFGATIARARTLAR